MSQKIIILNTLLFLSIFFFTSCSGIEKEPLESELYVFKALCVDVDTECDFDFGKQKVALSYYILDDFLGKIKLRHDPNLPQKGAFIGGSLQFLVYSPTKNKWYHLRITPHPASEWLIQLIEVQSFYVNGRVAFSDDADPPGFSNGKRYINVDPDAYRYLESFLQKEDFKRDYQITTMYGHMSVSLKKEECVEVARLKLDNKFYIKTKPKENTNGME